MTMRARPPATLAFRSHEPPWCLSPVTAPPSIIVTLTSAKLSFPAGAVRLSCIHYQFCTCNLQPRIIKPTSTTYLQNFASNRAAGKPRREGKPPASATYFLHQRCSVLKSKETGHAFAPPEAALVKAYD